MLWHLTAYVSAKMANSFSAWLPAEARAISLRFDEGKGTTDMDEWTIDNEQLIIYDLTGRKVSEPQKGNLYIVNGKKIIN